MIGFERFAQASGATKRHWSIEDILGLIGWI
jgi:hypothetical protein